MLKTSQEDVKKASLSDLSAVWDIEYELVAIKPELLENLRNKILDETLEEFGKRLASAIHPYHKPFTKQYIHRLENGHDRITPEIEAAYWNIVTALDDVPVGIGGAVNVNLLAQPNQIIDGAFISRTARTMKCANPKCAVIFIRTHPRQKYHDPGCRRNAD